MNSEEALRPPTMVLHSHVVYGVVPRSILILGGGLPPIFSSVACSARSEIREITCFYKHFAPNRAILR